MTGIKSRTIKTMWTAAVLPVLCMGVSTAAQEGSEKAKPSTALRGIRLIEDEHKIRVEIDGRHFTDYDYGVEP